MALVDIPIVIGRDDKYELTAEYRDSDGALVPLTGFSGDIIVSDSLDPIDADVDVQDPGVVVYTISHLVTRTLPEGIRLRFRIIDTDGEPTTLIKGVVTYG